MVAGHVLIDDKVNITGKTVLNQSFVSRYKHSRGLVIILVKFLLFAVLLIRRGNRDNLRIISHFSP